MDHSLILQHGLIRIFLKLPANPGFQIALVSDPYGCALTTDPSDGQPVVSVYRRPLPTANLDFLSTIMFDGRETHAPLNNAETFAANLNADLTQQALDAITIHAQASQAPTAAQLADIVAFELGLFSAQVYDAARGGLECARRAGRRSVNLAGEPYYPGINDSLGADPSGAAFNPVSMTLFSAWANLDAQDGNFIETYRDAARRKIAAGAALFNSAPVQISNVRGLNDNATLGNPTTFHGSPAPPATMPRTSGTTRFPCRSISVPDTRCCRASSRIRTSPRDSRALSVPDLPVYLINGCPNPFNPGQPESFYTTDPGEGPHLRAVQRLQSRQGPDSAGPCRARSIFPQWRRRELG